MSVQTTTDEPDPADLRANALSLQVCGVFDRLVRGQHGYVHDETSRQKASRSASDAIMCAWNQGLATVQAATRSVFAAAAMASYLVRSIS
jgi:hypothetical protein